MAGQSTTIPLERVFRFGSAPRATTARNDFENGRRSMRLERIPQLAVEEFRELAIAIKHKGKIEILFHTAPRPSLRPELLDALRPIFDRICDTDGTVPGWDDLMASLAVDTNARSRGVFGKYLEMSVAMRKARV